MWYCRAFVVSIGLFVTVSAVAAQDRLDVKYTYDDLSPSQQESLRKQEDLYASFEYSLQICGRRSNIEARLIAAVSQCVSDEALRRVSNYWHRRLAYEVRSKAQLHLASGTYCSSSIIQTIESKYLAFVDADVRRAKGLCDACLLSGICR